MSRGPLKLAPAETSSPRSVLISAWSFAQSVLTSTKWWWVFCLFCAVILTWNNRHSMNPDGLSYLDLASEASKHGPVELVNGYWSPAYPSLISAAFFLFHPTADQEFPIVHVLNLFIFVLALVSFSVFYRYWSEMTFERDEAAKDGKSVYITPFAFSVFLWFTLEFIGLEFVTPD